MAEESSLSIDDLNDLKFTQGLRGEMVRYMTQTTDGGSKIPADKDHQSLLVKLLDGMDKQVINKAKIKSEDTKNKSDADIRLLMAKTLSSLPHAKLKGIARGETIELPADVTITDIVPGEMDIGTQELTYAEFMNKDD